MRENGRSERPQNRTDTTFSGRSFFRKKVQIRRNFATTCTQKSTQGAKLQADASVSYRSGLFPVTQRQCLNINSTNRPSN